MLGCPDTVKMKKLKMRLKLPHWQCVGLLEALWLFTARNAPDGDIGRHTNEDIAACLEWTNDPDQLILTLVELHWLDEHPDHRLVVHDWADHCPTWIKGRWAAAAKVAEETASKTASKIASKIASKTSPQTASKTGSQTGTKAASKTGSSLPSHSLPSHSIPSPTTNDTASHDPAQSTPPTSAKAADWGVVGERLKSFGVIRPSAAIGSAKQTHFNPLQVIALIDWLEQQPGGAYQPGVIVERLANEDAAQWDAHQNWPPPAAVTVASDPSPYAPSAGQQALAEQSKRDRAADHARKAAEIAQLEATLGPQLDALDEESFAALMTDSPSVIRSQLSTHGRGRESPIRGVLLKHLHANRPPAAR